MNDSQCTHLPLVHTVDVSPSLQALSKHFSSSLYSSAKLEVLKNEGPLDCDADLEDRFEHTPTAESLS